MKRPIMYSTELRKYTQLGTALDSRGKLINAPVIHISKDTIQSLPSLCRKESDDTSFSTINPKSNLINDTNNVSD